MRHRGDTVTRAASPGRARLAARARRALLALPLLGHGLRRLSGAITHAPPRSPLRRLVRLRGALRPPASGRQVLDVLDVLEALPVRYWVAGGWGIDALVGRQSRDHDDLDVVLDEFPATVEMVGDALRALGFRVLERAYRPTWMPDRWHLESGVNLHVELVSLDLARLAEAAAVARTTVARLEPYATGTIDGRRVPCLSTDAQWIVHGGYEPRPVDRHDLVLLQGLRSSKE